MDSLDFLSPGVLSKRSSSICGAPMPSLKRLLLCTIGAVVVTALGYCAFIVAANMGIDILFR